MNQKQISPKRKLLIEAFLRFAIPGPQTTPQEIKRRGQIITVIAVLILCTIFSVNLVIGKFQQQAIIDQAIALHSKIVCHEEHNDILVLCLPKKIWEQTNPEVRNAWVKGEVYIARKNNRLIVGDEEKNVLLDYTIRVVQKVNKTEDNALKKALSTRP